MKTIKLAAIALSAIALTVACKNAPEATEDTTPIDTTPIEEIVEDTMPAIDTVEVAPAEKPAEKPAAKPAAKTVKVKKQESTPEITKTTTENGVVLRAPAKTEKEKIVVEKKNTREEKRIAL